MLAESINLCTYYTLFKLIFMRIYSIVLLLILLAFVFSFYQKTVTMVTRQAFTIFQDF